MRRLLIRPGAIGDLVVSLPALEALRADYTEVWVARQNVPLVRFADRVEAIADTELDLAEIHGPSQQLAQRLGDFDDIVSWYGANRDQFRDAVSGFGFNFFPALPGSGGRHACDYYLEQVGGTPGACPTIPAPPVRREFAAIHPFSGSPRKNWPIERFIELAGALSERMPIYWCAGPEEELPPGVRQVRFEDLYELACWLAGACVYIGNDSGPTHIAAAVGTPVVALFQASDPVVWAPRGRAVTVLEGASALDSSSVRVAVDMLIEKAKKFR